MKQEYTIIIRKAEACFIALCIELNVCSTGETPQDAKRNIENAINLFLEDIKANPETIVEPISIEEFIDFIKDSEEDSQLNDNKDIFKSFEINSLPAYA